MLWLLSNDRSTTARAELVALTDAVELELFSGDLFRRRWRFLRDAAARQYADRVKLRMVARGFRDRRGGQRTIAWPQL